MACGDSADLPFRHERRAWQLLPRKKRRPELPAELQKASLAIEAVPRIDDPRRPDPEINSLISAAVMLSWKCSARRATIAIGVAMVSDRAPSCASWTGGKCRT
jgi:hypothetical protein